MRKIIIACAATLMVLAASCGAAAEIEGSVRNTPVVKVVKEWAGSVVNISTEKVVILQFNPAWQHYRNLFGDQLSGESVVMNVGTMKLKGLGSGVIVSKEGLIVTNAHVIDMASKVYCILNDGTSFEAQIVGTDKTNDLALIKIALDRDLKPIEFADEAMLGETVISIGNPFGLENSVSVGVISGFNRQFNAAGSNQPLFDSLIQTDASINQGSSGGALLNLEGKLVGVALAVMQNAQSVGFAIPNNKIRAILKEYDNYKRRGKTVRIPVD
jgi:serine protease Do